MGIVTGQEAIASDFIDEAERNATPANDEGRVPKLEADGRLHPFFTKLGTRQLNAGETLNGATTPVPVYQNKTDNELYACDANDTAKMKFIGFVTSNSTDANAIVFQGAGIVDGFSGLQEGEKYYVQDTAGTIGTSPGTYEILVGVAISTTQLLIQKGRRRAGGVLTISDQGADETTTAYTQTIGFRPSVIRIYAAVREATSGDRIGLSGGIWINGTYASWYASHVATNSEEDTATNLILNPRENGTEYYQVTIANVTDTAFDFSVLQKVADPDSVEFVWEAEGEL